MDKYLVDYVVWNDLRGRFLEYYRTDSAHGLGRTWVGVIVTARGTNGRTNMWREVCRLVKHHWSSAKPLCLRAYIIKISERGTSAARPATYEGCGQGANSRLR